jgi:hypothetical protein
LVGSSAAPRWLPRVSTVPSNALKFYLDFGQPMTQGDMFSHLQLIDETKDKPVPGAFRETELWSPNGTRFTLWLHPGRQKTGVNLNKDEGPVLIEGHLYALVLKHTATNTEGKELRRDVVQRFAAGPADHAIPDPKRWKITPPKVGTIDPLIIKFDKPMDTAMLPGGITVHDDMVADDLTVNEQGTEWRFIPCRKWTPGVFSIEIDPNLEDLAGNNLLRPFEFDATTTTPSKSAVPVKVSFEVK